MTEVFFYILEDAAVDAPAHFVCRLTEKAHGEGHRVYVHVADPEQAEALDRMLWSFRQGSFVPHATVANRDAEDDITPVVIGAGDPPAGFDDVLVNLGGEVGGFFSRFARQNEIVAPDRIAEARQRYRFYKDRGYRLTTHKIPAR